MVSGVTVTLIPLLSFAFIGRLLLKMKFVRLCGMLAGSMTDPPALAFATAFNSSEEPLLAYAALYPATMIARVFAAQILVFLLAR
jgi:putative transport protein